MCGRLAWELQTAAYPKAASQRPESGHRRRRLWARSGSQVAQGAAVLVRGRPKLYHDFKHISVRAFILNGAPHSWGVGALKQAKARNVKPRVAFRHFSRNQTSPSSRSIHSSGCSSLRRATSVSVVSMRALFEPETETRRQCTRRPEHERGRMARFPPSDARLPTRNARIRLPRKPCRALRSRCGSGPAAWPCRGPGPPLPEARSDRSRRFWLPPDRR